VAAKGVVGAAVLGGIGLGLDGGKLDAQILNGRRYLELGAAAEWEIGTAALGGIVPGYSGKLDAWELLGCHGWRLELGASAKGVVRTTGVVGVSSRVISAAGRGAHLMVAGTGIGRRFGGGRIEVNVQPDGGEARRFGVDYREGGRRGN
jgi:hypothetical protein